MQAIIATGTPKEIAALVVATQERQVEEIKVEFTRECLVKDLSEAIRGTLPERPSEG